MIINNSNRAITTHCFDVDDAIKHGVEKAILLYNIKFWLEHNRANNTNFHDGKWWTFNSADAFATLFPYLNSKKISRLLKELENDGVILVGNYNKKGYDRTKWYSTPYHASFPKNEKWISQICEMDIPDLSNAFPKFEQPIPDINQIKNTDVNTDTCGVLKNEKQVAVVDERKQLVNQLFNKWLELSGQRIKPSAKRLSHINARLEDGFTPEQIITAMTFVATDSWHVDNKHNNIELAIRSIEQLEKKLNAASSTKPNKGINHESSHTPIQSPATSNMQQLREQIAAERAAKQSNYQHDQELRTVH